MAESPYSFDVTAENFASIVLQGSMQVPVLVDFWAGWCQPCKILMPLLANLAGEYQGKFILAKVNTEEQQQLAAEYGIRSIPAVKLFHHGELVDEFTGALPEAAIREFLDRHIPRASDNLVAEANRLLRQGETEKALELMKTARIDDPGNPRVTIAMSRLRATQGKIDEAESLLDSLPPDAMDSPEVAALRARLGFDRATLEAPPAELLARALAEGSADSEALYQLAAYRVMESDYEAALELLLQLLRRDRAFGDDAARKGMLALFELMGAGNPLVARYRSRLFNALH
jgi:putative thioredoxin